MSENNGKKMRRYGKNFWTRFIDLFRASKNRKAPENLLEEEAITTPVKTIIKNYLHNPIGMIGLVGFLAIFLTVMIGAGILKYDPYYSQGILKNIGPGFGYMNYPKHLTDADIVDIRSGITFSAGINADGKLYFWGKDYDGATVVPDKFKKQLEEEKVVHLAVGDRHTLVHTDKGNFYGWGNNYFGQDTVPGDVSMVTRSEGVKKMDAGVQFSVILTEKGNLLVWGSTMANNLDRVPKELKNNVEDFDVSSLNIIAARKDGGVQIFGAKGSPIYNIPKELEPGGIKVKQVAIGTYSCLALCEDGKLRVWGASQEGRPRFPISTLPLRRSVRVSIISPHEPNRARSTLGVRITLMLRKPRRRVPTRNSSAGIIKTMPSRKTVRSTHGATTATSWVRTMSVAISLQDYCRAVA